ncbi:polyphosphate kinase [compost metagenome]
MERNLDRRVEALVPVRDPEILEHLRDVVLSSYLRDTDRAFVLDSAGRYERATGGSGEFDAQRFLVQHYSEPHD